jgi:CBS domain containing-hemolysin-like protein
MPAGTVLLRLASALGLVALNGYFVAVEFAIVAVRRTRIDRLAVEGNATARVALKLMDNPGRVIAASQLGITMASLALGWIGEATVAAIIEPPLAALIGRWSEAAAHSIGTALAFAMVTFTHIVIGEQVPKTIAIRYAEGSVLAVSRIMEAFIRLLRPFCRALGWLNLCYTALAADAAHCRASHRLYARRAEVARTREPGRRRH